VALVRRRQRLEALHPAGRANNGAQALLLCASSVTASRCSVSLRYVAGRSNAETGKSRLQHSCTPWELYNPLAPLRGIA